MKKLAAAALFGAAFTGFTYATFMPPASNPSFDTAVQKAFAGQGYKLSATQLDTIRQNVLLGISEACKNPGNSKVDFTSVEIAQSLALNPQTDTLVVNRISAALQNVAQQRQFCNYSSIATVVQPEPNLNWETYFNKTVSLNNNDNFLKQLRDKAYSPVKISWEDIGRYENSAWGDRISDVGIWVRKDEKDVNSAQLALSVRRDNNFSDKILVVPADKIKIHQKIGTQTVEKTLPQRLQELGLSSALRDKNVIVSNQFSIVPVPAYGVAKRQVDNNPPPRVAFNFSIYPYGSTNYVITDVIEGSSDAIVGAGSHQLLYANINGQKAPFTASRAADRQDLLKLEQTLKAKGMDVDVQRYYLIQIPLKQDAKNIQLSNMGTPPNMRHYLGYDDESYTSTAIFNGGSTMNPKKVYASSSKFKADMVASTSEAVPGLEKVAIGHGDTEGKYFGGSGYNGQRADEPIRVTVVYFVTPIGEVTQADIQQFANTFASWDSQAIWGGSFVTKVASN